MTTSNIFCVWYPSGGFGHFINAVLTMHGKNFVPAINCLTFSSTGDSHSLKTPTPEYFHNHWPGNYEFVPDNNHCVLIDNGIDDQNEAFRSVFPTANVIKVCYSSHSWPIVARTMIEKAMCSELDEQLPTNAWTVDDPWARREKYFLFLRDHDFRHAWQPGSDTNLDVVCLLEYQKFYTVLNSVIEVEPFEPLWLRWRQANAKYIDAFELAQKILQCLKNQKSLDLTPITDIWTQALVYYNIWLIYNFEVPHNDYSNWFTNTTDIVKMLENHGVSIDSN